MSEGAVFVIVLLENLILVMQGQHLLELSWFDNVLDVVFVKSLEVVRSAFQYCSKLVDLLLF